MSDDKVTPEIQPEDVERMLPIWYARACIWRNQVDSLCRSHRISHPPYSADRVTNASCDGVEFSSGQISWIERDYDGIMDSFDAPYDAVRTDDSRDVWINEWLRTELRKKSQQAVLDAEQARVRAKRQEVEERALLEKLKAKYADD